MQRRTKERPTHSGLPAKLYTKAGLPRWNECLQLWIAHSLHQVFFDVCHFFVDHVHVFVTSSDGLLARDAFIRTNRAVAVMIVRLSVRLSV